jgi:hypothetical protein
LIPRALARTAQGDDGLHAQPNPLLDRQELRPLAEGHVSRNQVRLVDGELVVQHNPIDVRQLKLLEPTDRETLDFGELPAACKLGDR